MRSRFAVITLLALCGALLAGCGGSGTLPGIGGSGGLNTDGTGTSNQDASMFFRFEDGITPDFIATDLTARTTILGTRIQGVQTTRIGHNQQVQRVTSILFTDPPVKKTYTLNADGTDGVTFNYSERVTGTTTIKVWQAASGTLTVEKVDGTNVEASFKAALEPAANATNTLKITRGLVRAKIQ